MVGYTLIGFFGPVVSLVISVGMANVAGATKKSCVAAAVFAGYCVGNIVGPQLVRTESVGRHYPELWVGVVVWYLSLPPTAPHPSNPQLTFCPPSWGNSYIITILLALALYFLLRAENRRRDGLHVDDTDRDRLAFCDLTDRENLGFRYVL